MSQRRRRTSFTTTFTTRSSSTTRAIPSPPPTRAVRRRRSRLLRRSRLKLLPRQPNQRRLPLRRRHLAARPHRLAPPRCRQALRRWWEQPQAPLSWRRHCLRRWLKRLSRFRINLRQPQALSRPRRRNLRPNSKVSRHNYYSPVNLLARGNHPHRDRARRQDNRCLDSADNRFRRCRALRPRLHNPANHSLDSRANRHGQVSRLRRKLRNRRRVPLRRSRGNHPHPDKARRQDNRCPDSADNRRRRPAVFLLDRPQ